MPRIKAGFKSMRTETFKQKAYEEWFCVYILYNEWTWNNKWHKMYVGIYNNEQGYEKLWVLAQKQRPISLLIRLRGR